MARASLGAAHGAFRWRRYSLPIRAIRSAILALGPRHMWSIPPGNDRCSFIASTVSPSRHTENSSHCQNDGYGLQPVGRSGGDDALGSGLEGDTALATSHANDLRFNSVLKSDRTRTASASAAGQDSLISKYPRVMPMP